MMSGPRPAWDRHAFSEALRALNGAVHPEDLLAAVAELEAAKLGLLLKAQRQSESPAQGDTNRLLKAEEAAERLGTTEDWLRRHQGEFPFLVRLSEAQVRFSQRGLENWIETNQRPGQ